MIEKNFYSNTNLAKTPNRKPINIYSRRFVWHEAMIKLRRATQNRHNTISRNPEKSDGRGKIQPTELISQGRARATRAMSLCIRSRH